MLTIRKFTKYIILILKNITKLDEFSPSNISVTCHYINLNFPVVKEIQKVKVTAIEQAVI